MISLFLTVIGIYAYANADTVVQQEIQYVWIAALAVFCIATAVVLLLDAYTANVRKEAIREVNASWDAIYRELQKENRGLRKQHWNETVNLVNSLGYGLEEAK